jgi:exopolysaccharide production protein ExoQ
MAQFDTSRIHAGCRSTPVLSGPFQYSDIGYVSADHYSSTGKILPVLERLFVVLLLLSSMNVITALTPSSKEQSEARAYSADVDTSTVLIEAGLYMYGGMLALVRWRRVLGAARAVWPLLALSVLACLSTIWSVQPTVSLRRGALLLIATMIAVYVGERYSIKEFASLLAQTLCLMMASVLILYLIAPGYVIDQSAYGGAWKGLSAYKNTFGEHMAVGVLLLVLIRFRHFRWVRYAFLLIGAGLLLLSRSATAAVCGVLSLAAIPVWRLLRGRNRLLVYFLVALNFSVGIYCILAFPEPIFQILGRDATLTGRTDLWTMLLPVIANRPILGYGYAAFWTSLNPEVLSVWMGTGRHQIPVADNGYIDLWLSLGALGICAFVYVFARSLRYAIDYIRSDAGFIGLWPIAYLCIFAADNMCESALLTRGTFPFLVFAILTTSLSMNHKRIVTPARIPGNQRLAGEWIAPAISR